MERIQALRKIIVSSPDAPGVYLMRDIRGKVIYVGKAKSLRKRLYNYLGSGLDSKTSALMRRVTDIELMLSSSEAMALLLEAKMIHKFKPRYNVSLRDDKVFLLSGFRETIFPRISITRKKDDRRRATSGHIRTSSC